MSSRTNIIGQTSLLLAILTCASQAPAVVLWSSFDPIAVNQNGAGTDLLGGAVKRDDTAADTLYFKFQVDPLSDETTEPYFAALELFENDTERLGVGNAQDAWAYSAFFPGAQSAGVPPAGYLDLRSAHPDPNALAHQAAYQCPHRGEAATLVFKIQYVPNGEDLVTVWLNPDLGPGANEMSQLETLTTRFSAPASFDELRLRHGGQGGGWTFRDLAIATDFKDFVDSSSAQPGRQEANLAQSEAALLFQSWLKSQGLPRVPVTAIRQTRDGYLWLSAGGELLRFDGLKFTPSPLRTLPEESPGEAPAAPHALLVDSQGRAWLADDEDGVAYHDGEGWHRFRIPKRVSGARISTLAEEPDGTLWAGGASGLFRFANGKFAAVPASSKLAGTSVSALFVDREGALWVGTEEGLNRLQHKSLFALGQGEGLGYGPIQGLALVSPGVLWAARPGDGIYRWDGRSFSRVRAAGLSAHNSQANVLLRARDGVCWVGCNGGLLRYKDPVAAADEVGWFALPGETVIALAEDSEGALWAGTQAGKLWQLREGQWREQLALPRSPPIRTILATAPGALWLGTGGSGLIRWEQGKTTTVGRPAGLPSEDVRALYRDGQGDLWVGTAAGLSRKRGEQIVNFIDRDGLPALPVSQILEDGADRLWLGTSQGIVCLPKNQLAAFAEGKQESLHPKIFTHADGLLSEECTGGYGPTGLKSRSGLLWFPTTKGVAVIAPQNWPAERPWPSTALEEILLDGVPLSVESPATGVRIPPGKHRLELRYTALRFDTPEATRFRYQLQNWDPNWIDAGTGRSAVYNFVPPGQYLFQVMACNSDGVWGPAGARLPLRFARHVWESWWVLGLGGAALLALVGGTVRLFERHQARTRLQRLEQERALERERTRIAQDLHDEMGAKLCRISFLSEHARSASLPAGELQQQIKSISDESREVLHSLDEIVWAVNPQNDTLEQVASYLAQFAQEYLAMTGVECELVVPPQMPAHPVSSQIRHHLFLAVREALANILKHSQATRARISMACQHGNFEIVVADDGQGFALHAPGGNTPVFKDTQDGLRNMTKRLAEVRGKCMIDASAGHGTRIQFILPLNPAPPGP